eukprot:scaffold3577_cov60-Attheya_sp.AAC.2
MASSIASRVTCAAFQYKTEMPHAPTRNKSTNLQCNSSDEVLSNDDVNVRRNLHLSTNDANLLGKRSGTHTGVEPELLDKSVPLPSPTSPLMIEGDKFYVSDNGVARTFYNLSSVSLTDDDTSHNDIVGLGVEEFYDLNDSHKKFVLRQKLSTFRSPRCSPEVGAKNAEGVVNLGHHLMDFDLQEIDKGVLGTAGTGATTWEASIAMSLFFSSNPHLLHGDVIELGSGVGLGGIMTQLAGSSATGHTAKGLRSLTLTDYNSEVLEQCEKNIRQTELIQDRDLNLDVKKLDWHDCASMDGMKKSTIKRKTFDTVLASDCAYRYHDIVALAKTMSNLLKSGEDNKIHIFGPYNRGGMEDLIRELKDERKMEVAIDWIELERYRLKPPIQASGSRFWTSACMRKVMDQSECSYASKSVVKFLHITVWHANCTASADGKSQSIRDID